jgi:hypothetical protein
MPYFHGSELVGVIWQIFGFASRAEFESGIVCAIALSLADGWNSS